jgi:hypothetical protein
VRCDNEVFVAAASAPGTVARDTTPPAAKPTVTSTEGPTDSLLPWDPIRVLEAEPVDASRLLKGLSVTSSAGAAPVAWSQEGLGPDVDWAGTVHAKGLLTTLDNVPSMATLAIGRSSIARATRRRRAPLPSASSR